MSELTLPGNLVSVDWLAAHLEHERLVVLDATVAPIAPFTKTLLPPEFQDHGIPGALRFDYDQQVRNPLSSLPHMMPTPEHFAAEVRKLGSSNNSTVVIYDRTGVYASPRGWWMFRAMGHDTVAVLDGGLPAWWQARQPLAGSVATVADRAGDFQSQPRDGWFCDAITVYQHLNDTGCVILDARSPGRFAGRDPEPRPGLRGGHMPNAKNLPFSTVLNDIHMKPVEELRRILAPLVQPGQQIITSCGSGLTACILTLAAAQAGHDRLGVYDGSWSEWGLPSKLPVVTEV